MMANVIAGADIVGRRPMSVLILGHSFVTRLDLYLKSSNLAPNLNISQGVDINLLGLRGAHLSDLFDCIPVVLDLNPDMVFIEIGTNDLCGSRVLPLDFVNFAFDFMSALYREGIKYIFFGQILPRVSPVPSLLHSSSGQKWFYHLDFNMLRHKFIRTNAQLQARLMGRCPFTYWRHRGLWNSTSHHLSGDGIHLNKDGMARYVRSLRGAVLLALQQFHNEQLDSRFRI